MKVEFSNLEIFERKMQERVEPIGKALLKAVETEKEVIRARTHQGIDVNGEPFPEYSRKHPGKNWASVRVGEGLQIGYVDLKFSGDMFRALKVSLKREGFKFLATIFFNERKQSQKAKGHHTGQLGRVKFKPRKFFGLSQQQRENIMSKIRNAK